MSADTLLMDIPRSYTALAEWLACMICLLQVRRRFSRPVTSALCAGFLLLQVLFLEVTDDLEGLWWFVALFSAVAAMYGFVWACSREEMKAVAYLCIRAFVMAEFAASLEWQIDQYFVSVFGWDMLWFRGLLLLLIYGLLYALYWALYRNLHPEGWASELTGREVAAYTLTGLAFFLLSNTGFLKVRTPLSGQSMAEIFIIRTLIDLGGVAIMYAYHVQQTNFRVRQELESVQSILHNQYVQYTQSREVMELINYKYHDLKNHIIVLRGQMSRQDREEYLDQLEAELTDYEYHYRTGNEVLDTLLTAKGLTCSREKIRLTCVVDGNLLSFMDTVDICSIFGNALDNAIECEKQIPEEEKRLIHVTMHRQKQFLLIRVENYYTGSLEFKGDLPTTTKKDEQYHGYGLKSIRYTVGKYGGIVDVSTAENWFTLNILIPMLT